VLWDLAGTLDMLDKPAKALSIYRKLLQRGVAGIAHGDHGEGTAWATALLVDCVYRIGVCFQDLRRPHHALHFLLAFLDLRSRCSGSIYAPDEALARISRLLKQDGKPDRSSRFAARKLEQLTRELQDA
jgi:hypothetical protein